MTPGGRLNWVAWNDSDGIASTSSVATGGPAGGLKPPPPVSLGSLGPSDSRPADKTSTANPDRPMTRVEERTRGVAGMAAPPARMPTVTMGRPRPGTCSRPAGIPPHPSPRQRDTASIDRSGGASGRGSGGAAGAAGGPARLELGRRLALGSLEGRLRLARLGAFLLRRRSAADVRTLVGAWLGLRLLPFGPGLVGRGLVRL